MRITQQLAVQTRRRPLVTSAEVIENEPMFYNATGDFLFDVECEYPLTSWFLQRLSHVIGDGEQWSLDTRSLDTRSHMLMRGWFPAIPGWHHDDVDRGPTGQPDYDAVWWNEARSMFVCVIDAVDAPTGSLTEFLADGEVVSVPWPVPDDAPVYRYWDAHIEREVDAQRVVLESGVIYRFDQRSFHRAMPATSNGWRWFARLIQNPGPRPAPPKLRRQTQVYLPTTNLGW